MLPGPLAPLDPHKTRALTTIYAPRKLQTRKNKTAKTRMLENNIPIKPSLSPFLPLPAIGQKLENLPKTKVIVFDLNKNELSRPGTMENRSTKLHDTLKPLTPLRIHGFARKGSLDNFEEKKPHNLLRENTYDVLEPVYLNAARVKKRDTSVTRTLTPMSTNSNPEKKTEDKKLKEDPRLSPRTRFKKAALQVAKLSCLPETGKLLCLRERETYNFCHNEDNNSLSRLQQLPRSPPTQKLNELSEIFQNLDMTGRHRDRIKKENSWF